MRGSSHPTTDEAHALARARNFLFDLDGTLLESSPYHDLAFRYVLASFRPELLCRFDYDSVKGKSTNEAFADYGVREGRENGFLTELKRAYYTFFLSEGDVTLFAGVVDLLSFLRRRGRRVFLTTSGSARSVAVAIAQADIADMFDGVVTANDVRKNKPDPELYLFTLQKFGLDRRDTVVVEDSENGVRAAVAAELPVIQVNEPQSSRPPTYYFPDIVSVHEHLQGAFGE